MNVIFQTALSGLGRAGLAGCLALMGCVDAPRPCSLIVLDAHGHPPDSGHVLVALPQNLSNGNTVLGWNVVSDTLRWHPETGEVLPTSAPPAGAHWVVHSPNPIPTGSWRTASIAVSEGDSCVLPIEVPWEMHLRTNRKIGPPIEGYEIRHSSDRDEEIPLAQSPLAQGSLHWKGSLHTHAFPVTLTLTRLPNPEHGQRIAAAGEFEYVGAHTSFTCHWEDNDEHTP